MLDGSMSACAEANGVKVGDITNSASLAITNNFNVPAVDSAKPSLIAKAISSVRGALDPAGCAREFAEARRLKTESDIEVYGLYRRNMPWLSERQAFLYANGFVTTPSQADNVFAVFEAAESKVDESDEAGGLSAPVVESVVDGAKGAYDDEARELWASVLAGEMERPGSVSKRTMRILSDMEKAHAEAFLKLCGFATYIYTRKSEKGRAKQPVIALFIDENYRSYNCNEITVDELSELESLGLIDKGMMSGLIVQAKTTAAFYSSDGLVAVSNDTDQAMEAEFKGAAFLPSGIELANICGVGDSPALRHILLEELEKQGFRTSLMNDWPFNEK